VTTTVQANVPFLNARSGVFTAWQFRAQQDGAPPGPGVADYESWRVMQRQAGANLSVDIGKTAVGLMQGWVRGGIRDGQGLYRCTNEDYTVPTTNTYLSQINEAGFAATDVTNPRIDRIILEVLDQQHSGASNVLQTRVVTGVATGGATLDNLTGAAAVPAGAILLADVLVGPTGSNPNALTANIRDRRPFPLMFSGSAIPAKDEVTFIPLVAPLVAAISPTAFDASQQAVMMYLPRKIVGATRINWSYQQGATVASTFYNIGVYDASMRLVNGSGAVAFAGTASQRVAASITIGATTFEPGMYWVAFGINAMTAASNVFYSGSGWMSSNATGPLALGQVWGAAAGGATMSGTDLRAAGGWADQFATGATVNRAGVPIITLSVG